MKRILPAICSLFFIQQIQAQSLTTWQESNNFNDECRFYDQQFSKLAGQNPFGHHHEFSEEKQDNGWLIYNRWKYFYRTRVDADGSMNYERRIFSAYNQQKNSISTRSSTNENWTSVGPISIPVTQVAPEHGDLGRVNCVTVDPKNRLHVVVGTAAGGLWQSFTGGNDWTTNTDLLSVLGVADIAIDPSNTQIQYLATGDRDDGNTRSIGVLKSTDGGVTWDSTGLSYSIYNNFYIYRLLLDSLQPNVLFAATSAGIFRTEDAGVNWILTTSGEYRYMEFKPRSNDSIIYASSSSQFFISRDNGHTWNASNNGLATNGVGRMAIAVTKANPEYVYALCSEYSDWGFYGLFRSTDGGADWTLMSSKPNLLGWDPKGGDTGGQGWYDLSLAASQDDADEIYTGGVNIWKSYDGGATWKLNAHWYGALNKPYVHADIHELISFPGGILFAVCDGGIFETTNDGISWSDLSDGLQITQYYRFSNSESDINTIIAGAQDNGTSFLSGTQWSEVFGGDGMNCLIDQTNSQTMYASIYYGNIYKSSGNNLWRPVAPIANGGDWVTPYIIDPSDHEHLVYGGKDIFQSFDGGLSWTRSTDGLIGGNYFESLAIPPSDSNTIYAASYSKIFRTNDRGNTWQDITPTFAFGTSISDIAVKNTDSKTLWITFSGFTGSMKVLQSKDGGDTWENISSGIPNIPVNCIAYESGNLNQLYAGTDLGVYYLDSTMGAWVGINKGLPDVIVDQLQVMPTFGLLRAATFGRGVWQTPLIEENVTAVPSVHSSDEIKIFPNPAAAKLVVQFPARHDFSVIELKNEMGQVVARNEVSDSGNQQVSFDVSKFPAGKYLVMVSGKNNSIVRKVTITH